MKQLLPRTHSRFTRAFGLLACSLCFLLVDQAFAQEAARRSSATPLSFEVLNAESASFVSSPSAVTGAASKNAAVETVSDGSFEAGTPNPFWTESSTNFGTPLCTTGTCGFGTGTGPHTGTYWAWFGGIAAFEAGAVSQSVTIPAGTATLSFFLEIPAASGNGSDFLEVSLDGTTVFSVLESDAPSYPLGYAQVSVDVSAWADGGVHTLLFDGEISGTGVTNFFVDDVSLEVEPLIDLSLEKDCEINPDGTGIYFLTLRNDGLSDATGIEVQDDLPAGIDDIVADASQGSFNSITGRWIVGTLAAGDFATLEIDYTFDPEVEGDYSNQAEVVAADQDDDDSVPGDGMGDDYAECGAMFSPNPIDLSLQKDCAANDDGTGLYFLTVSNDGPGDATGVQVQDWLPDLLSNVDGDESQGGFNPITGLWIVGDLAAGNTATLQIDFTFDPDVDAEYLNHAEVVAANQADSDSTPDDGEGDDYDECLFIVSGDHGAPEVEPGTGPGGSADPNARFEADLRVTKTVDVETAATTTNVEYTITVTDTGPHSTTGVSIEDVLPACLTFVSAAADRGSYDATTGLWTVGSVKVGETLTLTLVAEVGSSCTGTVTNTASVASSRLPDPLRLPDAPNSPINDPFETPATILNNTASAAFDVSTGRVLDGTGFALGENYPNPFNPTTVVPYSLSETAHVSIKVYDMLGREVAVLVEGQVSAGVHEVTFEAGSLPTGVYLIRMEAAGVVQTQRVTLMK